MAVPRMDLDSRIREKKKKKPKSTVPDQDIFIQVKLFRPTGGKYPCVNFAEAVKEKYGFNPLEADAAEENDTPEHRKLLQLAKQYEEKYGPKGKKMFGNVDDYMDLGMGYDKEDNFIDDSEAYDELVPSNLKTKLGGFYVNRGPLEFRERTPSPDSAGTVRKPTPTSHPSTSAEPPGPSTASAEPSTKKVAFAVPAPSTGGVEPSKHRTDGAIVKKKHKSKPPNAMAAAMLAAHQKKKVRSMFGAAPLSSSRPKHTSPSPSPSPEKPVSAPADAESEPQTVVISGFRKMDSPEKTPTAPPSEKKVPTVCEAFFAAGRKPNIVLEASSAELLRRRRLKQEAKRAAMARRPPVLGVHQNQLGNGARKQVVGPDGRVCTSLVENAETVMRRVPAEPVKERHLEDSIASVLQRPTAF